VPRGVDAGMDPPETAAAQPEIDRIRPKPQSDELAACHYAVLPLGQRRDPQIDVRSAAHVTG
jgi:hypothetical protein